MLKSTWKVNQPLGKPFTGYTQVSRSTQWKHCTQESVTLMKAHTIAEIQQTLQQAAWCTGIKTTKKVLSIQSVY